MPPLNSLHVWLDANIALNLSREAVEALEIALRYYLAEHDPECAALETAANQIRAHLQHLPPKGIPLHHEEAGDPLLA